MFKRMLYMLVATWGGLSVCAQPGIGSNGEWSVADRTPNEAWNVAIVIDCSHLAGPDVRTRALDFLGDLMDDDIVSVVAYADHVRLVMPPRRLGSRRDDIIHEIAGLSVSGGAALFAGMSIGVMELRKNEKLKRPNLLKVFCQGWGTIGPSRPDLMDRIVTSFNKIHIKVEGLPWNERDRVHYHLPRLVPDGPRPPLTRAMTNGVPARAHSEGTP